MQTDLIQLTTPPIGQGRERVCYLHPQDDTKVIKIAATEINVQSRREIDFYCRLQKRKFSEYTHIPQYHGVVKTNLGDGIVVDLITDHDQTISPSMLWYLKNGTSIKQFEASLAQLKHYLLENRVIFNHDMMAGNLLWQQLSPDSARLVVIDGLGDTVSPQWLNAFASHVEAKINRRWDRFIKRLYRSPEVRHYLD